LLGDGFARVVRHGAQSGQGRTDGEQDVGIGAVVEQGDDARTRPSRCRYRTRFAELRRFGRGAGIGIFNTG